MRIHLRNFFESFYGAGILPSNDKLLHSRIHAYSDAQRYRLGVNYLMLPINAPRNLHFNGNYDGLMNFAPRRGNEQVVQRCHVAASSADWSCTGTSLFTSCQIILPLCRCTFV